MQKIILEVGCACTSLFWFVKQKLLSESTVMALNCHCVTVTVNTNTEQVMC